MTTQSAKTASAVPTANSAETTIVTSDSVTYAAIGSEGVMVSGTLSVLTGATVTAVVVTVRKGVGVAGAIVGAARTHTIGAAANAQIPFSELDASPVSPTQYTVTIAQTGGTSAGTVSALITTDPVTSVAG